MTDACLVFLLHHPERLRHVRVFDEGVDFGNYVDEPATSESLRAAASRSFLPALKLLREAVERSGGAVRLAICPTGPLLRSAERHHAALMRSLHRLHETGAVEWVCAPWDHSVLSIFPGEHLTAQFDAGARAIQRLFGVRPTTAANTELIYDNTVARRAAAAGIKLVLAGNADRSLAGRTANRVYRAAGAGEPPVKVLARHVGLSDDWGVRFSDSRWACYPLKPETYADWIAGSLRDTGGPVCPIVLHLSDLGLTHAKQSGIFSFTRRLLGLLGKRGIGMVTPSQAAERAGPAPELDVLDVPQATSGWGPAFDLTPWLGNAMQSNALHLLRQAIGHATPPAPGNARGERHAAAVVADGLLRLCAADHLHAMRYDAAAAAGASAAAMTAPARPGAPAEPATIAGERFLAPAEERRRPVPYEGPYDAYLDYTNALRHVLGRERAAS